jgi:hypothetical protein
MTEHEWLSADEPKPMLEFIHLRVSERKLRLFACACCRAMRYMSPPDLKGVEVAERFADGEATEADLEAAEKDATDFYAAHGNDESVRAVQGALAIPRHWSREPRWDVNDDPHWASYSASWAAQQSVYGAEDWDAARRAGRKVQADLLRDVIGNPFRQVAVEHAWRTAEALRLAESMYETHAFGRMHDLADRLEAAGCRDRTILGHCREPGPHARGCWVIDAILGKA